MLEWKYEDSNLKVDISKLWEEKVLDNTSLKSKKIILTSRKKPERKINQLSNSFLKYIKPKKLLQ